MHFEIGNVLAKARDEARMTQKQVAEKLGVHQSRISRLEASEGEHTAADYVAYLDALGTDRALYLKSAIQVSWRHLSEPSLDHPALSILMDIEAALERLNAFKQGDTVPHVLVGQADMLFRRLSEFGQYLLGLDHEIVYVGETGVGKTTVACRQTGLVTNPLVASDLKTMMLDTGGGRTTLGDTFVREGDRFAINVNPLPDEEVYRLVAELCRGIQEKRTDDGTANTTTSRSTTDFKPPEEVERAIRIMAGLPRPTRRKSVDAEPDPAAVLAAASTSLEEFTAEVASRLTLWRRTRRSVEFEGADQIAGRQWLRDTFTAINNGRHPDFSLPSRIAITVPFSLVMETPYNVTLVDTRGVDGSAIRPDIVAHLKNRRAVTVLCAKWGSAPDPSLQDVMKHVAETEVDPSLLNRATILVLARAGDALSMRHDSGDGAADVGDGYEIKQGHVEDALRRIGLNGVNCTIYDSASDKPNELTNFLMHKIETLRQVQVSNAKATIAAVKQMLENVVESHALATLELVNNDLRIFAERHHVLKESRRPIQSRLLNAVRNRHARSVWASARRAGDFWNFDVYQHLGDGAAADARRRCEPALAGLREIIENRLADPAFASAHGFLGQLLNNVEAWEADFVKAARHYSVTIFKPALAGANEMWSDCEDKYGRGLKYKEEVVATLEDWFEEHEGLQDQFDRRLRRAWRASVLTPLQIASGTLPQQEAA